MYWQKERFRTIVLAYNDIRDWIRREREGREKENSKIDWDDVVFEVDLLKSQEINLDYILELLFEKNQNIKDTERFSGRNAPASHVPVRKIVRRKV